MYALTKPVWVAGYYVYMYMYVYRREIGVLLDIIHAQQYTSEWQFLQAILAIQSSDNKLQIWNGVVPLKVSAALYRKFYHSITSVDIAIVLTSCGYHLMSICVDCGLLMLSYIGTWIHRLPPASAVHPLWSYLTPSQGNHSLSL